MSLDLVSPSVIYFYSLYCKMFAISRGKVDNRL